MASRLTPPSLLSGRAVLDRLEVEPLLASLTVSDYFSQPVIPDFGPAFSLGLLGLIFSESSVLN